MSKRIEADPLPSSSWPNSLPAHSWRLHGNGDITCLVTQATRNADRTDYHLMREMAHDRARYGSSDVRGMAIRASQGMTDDQCVAFLRDCRG